MISPNISQLQHPDDGVPGGHVSQCPLAELANSLKRTEMENFAGSICDAEDHDHAREGLVAPHRSAHLMLFYHACVCTKCTASRHVTACQWSVSPTVAPSESS